MFLLFLDAFVKFSSTFLLVILMSSTMLQMVILDRNPTVLLVNSHESSSEYAEVIRIKQINLKLEIII